MDLIVCDHSVIYVLAPLGTSQILGQTDRLQKTSFSIADNLCCVSENEPEVYAMGLGSS